MTSAALLTRLSESEVLEFQNRPTAENGGREPGRLGLIPPVPGLCSIQPARIGQ